MRLWQPLQTAGAGERFDLLPARFARRSRLDGGVDSRRRWRNVGAEHVRADHVPALGGRRLVRAPVPHEEHAQREEATARRGCAERAPSVVLSPVPGAGSP